MRTENWGSVFHREKTGPEDSTEIWHNLAQQFTLGMHIGRLILFHPNQVFSRFS
jgi:hypothetical protein